MRTLSEKYLGGLTISEEVYSIDLAVLDRYQSFSSELLRLSLLGITGYGFLLTNIALKISPTDMDLLKGLLQMPLPLGPLFFALSSTCALGHRYFSTDCITHYVRRLRLIIRHDQITLSDEKVQKLNNASNLGSTEEADDSIAPEELRAIIKVERSSLNKDLRRCKWLLIGSSIFLLLGAICVA